MKENCKVIGIGQCGNRIAKEFETAGFSACYINSDVIDVRGSNIAEEQLLIIDAGGTGKSIKTGDLILKDNVNKVQSFIRKNVNKTGLNLIIVGGGGGTGGSFAPEVAHYIKELGYRVGIIYTLPLKMLGIVPEDNSLHTLKKLLKENLDFFLLADNEYLLKSVSSESSWWSKVNKKILSNVYATEEIFRQEKSSQLGIGSIDQGELMRVLTYGKGLIDIRRYNLTINQCSLPEEEVSKILYTPQLVEGFDYKTTLCYMVSIDTPVRGNFTDIAKKVFDSVKKKSGNGIAILGMFTDPLLNDSIRVTIANAGLKLPKILQSRMKNLKRDSQAFVDKQQKQDSLEVVFDELEESVVDEFL